MKKTGLFKNITKAETPSTTKYIPPGFHLLKINQAKIHVAKKGPIAVIDFGVVESKILKKDEVVTWMIMGYGPAEHFFDTNVKSFLGALFEAHIVDEKLAEAVFGPTQPLKGWQVCCDAKEILTKAGHTFTKCNWLEYGSVAGGASLQTAKGMILTHNEHMIKLGGIAATQAALEAAKQAKQAKQAAKIANFGMQYGKSEHGPSIFDEDKEDKEHHKAPLWEQPKPEQPKPKLIQHGRKLIL